MSSLMNILPLAGSALSAQSQRLNTVASNLANADTVAGPDGSVYKARQVVFKPAMVEARQAAGARQWSTRGASASMGVRVVDVIEDPTPGKRDRGEGEHDLGLTFLSEQRRDDEHGPAACTQDAVDRSVNEGYLNRGEWHAEESDRCDELAHGGQG